MGENTLTYEVDGDDYVRAGEASRKTKMILKTLGIPSDVIRRTGICMYEGEINMVIHADGGVITVDIDEDKITLVLKDHGKGIADLDKAFEEGYSTAGEEARNLGFGAGMGLPNMKKCSDSMTVETTVGVGTTVTMVLNIV